MVVLQQLLALYRLESGLGLFISRRLDDRRVDVRWKYEESIASSSIASYYQVLYMLA